MCDCVCTVLADPHKKAIYDTTGIKGLETDGWEVWIIFSSFVVTVLTRFWIFVSIGFLSFACSVNVTVFSVTFC